MISRRVDMLKHKRNALKGNRAEGKLSLRAVSPGYIVNSYMTVIRYGWRATGKISIEWMMFCKLADLLLYQFVPYESTFSSALFF
ncbi:MAG: hypothetical protein PWP24_701 [Clostridiales bacterium]|nr:hypothetical protein [Clostridiales bacterium]